jgi:hypothetical protein
MLHDAGAAVSLLDELGHLCELDRIETHDAASGAGARAQRVAVGSWVRIESEGRSMSWCGHISYVNGEILGLRGAASTEDLFAARDNITMRVGRAGSFASSQARVLVASGRTLRILLRRSVGDLERRRAARVRVAQPVRVARINGDDLEEFGAELIDLSAFGCAVRSASTLATSDRVSIAMNLDGTALHVVGEVVRTWRNEVSEPVHAGIHLDAITTRQESLIRRFLVDQLRHPQYL